MGNLQYRSTVWICQRLCKDSEIPLETSAPLPLFHYVMQSQPSWGRYAIFFTWLDRQFPSQGYLMFGYLKRDYSMWMYSFPYLLGLYVWYNVVQTIQYVCGSLTTRIVRRGECVCQSLQDTAKESKTTIGTAPELYTA